MTAPADETEEDENLDADWGAALEEAEGGKGNGDAAGGDEEDDLAAEWGAALGEGDEDGGGGDDMAAKH